VSRSDSLFNMFVCVLIGMLLGVLTSAPRQDSLEDELEETKLEMARMHDYFYAQWANAVGYRAILEHVYNFTIEDVEPFEVYHEVEN